MDLTELQRHGYQVASDVISRAEIFEILREVERLRGIALAATPLDPSVRILWGTSRSGAPLLRSMQNAHCISPLIDALRLHAGIAAILVGVLGPDVKTVLTSIFWKSPGEAETGIAYHQDAGFRRPETAFRNLAQSYLQVAIALDSQDEENGGLHFIPGSHRQARLFPRSDRSVLTGDAGAEELRALGFAPETARSVHLRPGDAVMWNAFTLHGSPPNRSLDRDRRSFTIAFMRSADCDAGIDAYVKGRPVPAV